MTDGARTRDNRNHNPGLYRLSYGHHLLPKAAEAVCNPLFPGFPGEFSGERWPGSGAATAFGLAADRLLDNTFRTAVPPVKLPRPLILLPVCLAAGVALRTGLAALHRPAAGRAQAAAPAADMPDWTAMPSGPALRQLVAWLPGAAAADLRREADRLAAADFDGHHSVIPILMVRWAELDAPGMLAWATAADGRSYGGINYRAEALTAWAREDFGAAIAAASGMPGLRAVPVAGLAYADPDKCLRLLAEDPELLRRFFQLHPPDPLARLTAHNPAAAAALLDGLPPDRMDDARISAQLIGQAWVRVDPAAAVAWVSSRPHWHSATPRLWLSRHAPEHLAALIRALPAGRVRILLQARALAVESESDPEAVSQKVETMPPSPFRQQCRLLLLQARCRRGEDEAAWALAEKIGWQVRPEWLPEHRRTFSGPGLDGGGSTYGSSRDSPAWQAMQQLTGRMAVRDPQRVAQLFSRLTPAEASELISGDTEAHPADVAELVVKAGDPASRQILEDLARKWMAADSAAAMAWAARHETPVYLFLSLWKDVPAALAWLAEQPAKTRAPWMLPLLTAWSNNGARNLREDILQSPLPESEKKELLTRLPPP